MNCIRARAALTTIQTVTRLFRLPSASLVCAMLIAGWLSILTTHCTIAQEAPVAVQEATAAPPSAAPSAPVPTGPDGKPVPGARPGRPGGPGGPGQPPQPGQPGQPADAAAGAKTPEGPKVVTRPDKPSLPPDPRELKVKPDPQGKIRFNFHGQPWADVLEWLAAVSAMSLDWQELPGDYLNLVTQREYTIPEARDLINRHLLARGYTLLIHGEVLSVVKIEKLNPGLVPRVDPEELGKLLPHDYVKVSFPLDWLISERAVEELKPMLSPNAKLTPLKNTNRLEAIDAAINLQEVYALLKREQSDEPQQKLIKEFKLNHSRPADVIDQLKSLLGIETKSANATPMSPQQMEMMQQQAMMMQQQMQQRGGGGAAPPKKDDDVHLVANTKKNSILAHAPPDKMEIITQAVAAIDVESDQAQSLLSNINRMQVYRLHAVDPQTLVKTLLDIGQMDPATRLEVDAKNKAIIAYAALADHLTIRQVIERLDGSGRKFEVVQLRRLEADYVAGTIEFMMVGPPKKEQQQSRYFDFYSPYGRSSNETKETDQFRVDADTANNKLLLWANEIELQEVNNLLAKLGEIPIRGGNPERLRVLDALPPDQMQQLLERLRQAWPALAPNQLNLPPTPTTGTDSPSTPRFDSFELEKEAHFEPLPKAVLAAVGVGSGSDTTTTAAVPPVEKSAETPSVPADAAPATAPPKSIPPTAASPVAPTPKTPLPSGDQAPDAARTSTPPPISISVSPDGRIVLFSQDTQALDILEELIGQVAPPRKDYRIYKLKHADSFWVRKNLEDFFEEEDDKKSANSRYVYYYDSYYPPEKNGDARQRLSKKRKLKLIDDLDTNSILVQGADAEQLRTIEDLIRIYDQPQQADASSARVSAVIQIQFSKAQTIATAVKDVYRDLLSSNDKALASNNPEQKNRIPSGANTYIFNEGGEAGGEKERTRVTFKGKLSVGVDEVTNTLLVSTEGENLMKNITEMVRSLDEAAKPLSSVSIVKVGANSNAAKVREALNKILLEAKTPAQQPPGQPQRNQQQAQQQAAENGGVVEGAGPEAPVAAPQ